MEMAGFRFDGMNLLDMFCEALVIWEASTGAVLYTNESARALYGYSCGEASALSIDDIFPDWEGGLRKGSFSIRTATHRKKDGMFFPVQLTCRSLPGNAGDVMMMVASDVSPENLIHDSVSLAASIQRGFLPGDLEGDGRIEVRGIYRPMHLISGDMFGYQWDERQGILSGYLFDVMGHGVPAALRTSAIMVLFHQAFEDDARAGASLEEKLAWVNSMAEGGILSDSFAAAVCFRLNVPEKKLDYCAAGINGFLYGSGAGLKKIITPGSLLGISGTALFGSGSLRAEPGEYFLFLSDGFLDQQSVRENEHLSFSGAYDRLFQVGYTGRPGTTSQHSACCSETAKQGFWR